MPRLSPDAAQRRASRRLEGAAAPADYSEALARGLAVLEALGEGGGGQTLADLARELDLPRATVRRAVLTLEHLGFVRTAGRTLALTPQVLRLATAYLAGDPLGQVLQPACEEVVAELGEACGVAVLDGADAVVVARAQPRRLVPVGTGIGFRVPAAGSALGRVLLAGTGAPGAELDRVRAQGWAYVADEVEAGLQSVAVPLRRADGVVVAAMHVASSTGSRTQGWMTGTAREVLSGHAEELRRLLV
ncbi:IclR family transcriptional regulator domain-containing protein [Trujillonella humicola]|uniref:IclR family transcriptional regulator domain-containing protein n=1 Tax=Trujillonella humicola TaxID=3383699 RepID=UPI003905B73F